jgi:hypothetical protein
VSTKESSIKLRVYQHLLLSPAFRGGSVPIRRSAYDLLILINSCCKKWNRSCFVVSAINRFTSKRSTAEGWYLVSSGIGGITSVRLANRIVMFLLHKWLIAIQKTITCCHPF